MPTHYGIPESIDWPALLTAAGTVALAIVAIFGHWLHGIYYRPRLSISFNNTSPDCQRMPLELSFIDKPGERAWGYYYRLRIHNDGRGPANNVEVFASMLLKQNPETHAFEEVTSFIPMNLSWSHSEDWFSPAILPNMYRHCNLGQTTSPRKYRDGWGKIVILFLTLQVRPNNGGERVPPGIYHLKLKVAAANIKRPSEATFEINNTGAWHDEEEEMLSEGISIEKL